MKALTLTQPWATLVALGAKQIETRSWKVNYRGKLLIHAASAFPKEAKELCFRDPFTYDLNGTLFKDTFETLKLLPRGTLVCIVNLVDIVPTSMIRHILSHRELAYGNYDHGRYAWVFDATRIVFEEPLAVRGRMTKLRKQLGGDRKLLTKEDLRFMRAILTLYRLHSKESSVYVHNKTR